MKQIMYDAANIDTREGPDENHRTLVITEMPNGPAHLFVLPHDIARQIGCGLKGEPVVATPAKPKIVVPNGS